jgi:lambda family phage portal protein
MTAPTKDSASTRKLPPPPAGRRLRPGGARSNGFSTSAFSSGRTFYEAAARTVKKQRAVDPGPNGANGEIETVRAESRKAFANNGFYRQAVRQLANNCVGYGIKPIIPYPDLKKLWNIWVPESDTRGRLDFYGQEWFGTQITAKDGEVVYRLRDRLEGDMYSGIPLQIQMMEADHLPLGYTQQSPSGNWIVDGVERNAIDRVIGYWLYPHHPKDWRGTAQALTPQFVPAEDVIHMYMPERPTDERGVPWGAAILTTVETVRSYNASELEKKDHQAKFTVFYKKPIDEEKGFNGNNEYDGDLEFQTVRPGGAVEVPEGYDVTFPQQPSTDSNYGDFQRFNMTEVAVCLGLAVEHITLNFEKVNDRVYRAIMLEVGRFIESIQYHMIVQQFCTKVWRRFVSAAILAGKWTPPEGAKPEDYMRVEWRAPARGHIHPLQEVMAFIEAVRNGFTSRSKVAAEFGDELEEIDFENARDLSRAKELQLHYPVYPSLTDGSIPTGPETVASLKLQDLERKALIDALLKMAEAETA